MCLAINYCIAIIMYNYCNMLNYVCSNELNKYLSLCMLYSVFTHN